MFFDSVFPSISKLNASMFQDKEPLRSIQLRDIQKVHECLVKSGWVKNKSWTQPFSVPLHLFVWVTVGSTLEWFHKKLNSCLTGLLCLQFCGKKNPMHQYFYYTNTNPYCFGTKSCNLVLHFSLIAASKMRTVSYSKQQSAPLCGGSACQSSFFEAKQQLWLGAWVKVLYEWKLSLLECSAVAWHDARGAGSVRVGRLRILWMKI